MIWLDIQNYNPANTANAAKVLPFYGAAESVLAALGAFMLVLLAIAFVIHLGRWAFGVHSGHLGAAGGGLQALIVIFMAIVGIAAAAAITNHFFDWGQQVINK